MLLADILPPERIRVSLPPGTVTDGVGRLLPLLLPHPPSPEEGGAPLLARLARGEGGEVRNPGSGLLLLALEGEDDEEPRAVLGVASEPLAGDGDIRILVLLLIPAGGAIGPRALDRIERRLRTPDVRDELLAAETPTEVRTMRRLMNIDLGERGKVEHAMTPLSFRVYPDTPVEEVIDLMARKALRALPVVGEEMEVLGVITEDEALRQAMRGRQRGDAARDSGLTAREVMSRTVMCVSEDAELLEAARLMISKDVAHLPVVREGEIVGMLDRSALLRALFGG